MGEGFHGWSPKDEIEFVRGLTKALPQNGPDVSALYNKPDGQDIGGSRIFFSPQRPVTRAARLEALRKYLAVLPYRHFPGWSQREQQAVIHQATDLYTKAITEARPESRAPNPESRKSEAR